MSMFGLLCAHSWRARRETETAKAHDSSVAAKCANSFVSVDSRRQRDGRGEGMRPRGTSGAGLARTRHKRLPAPEGFTKLPTCILFLLGAALMMKFWKNLTGPCGAPTYLPTYLPCLWETKKENTRWVKGGVLYQLE